MSEAVLNKFIFNDKAYDVIEFDTIYEDKFPSVYEVIRIIDGVPLFLEEHFERLKKSAELLNYNIGFPISKINNSIIKMLEINNISDYNIKIVVNNLSEQKQNLYVFFVKSQYPDSRLYHAGVETILYNAVRKNPNAKVIYKEMREEIDMLLKNTKCFEAVLVNDRQQITEGSRSNLFFIRKGAVYTSPATEVLLGITRQRIITLCNRNNIQVIEEPIDADALSSFDACFISGTSPKVLPINKINDIKFSVTDSTLRKIIDIYDEEIKRYIQENKTC